VRPTEIRREESPEQYWVFTGASLLIASAAAIALVQSFRKTSPQLS
jgi:hypothetical protein